MTTTRARQAEPMSKAQIRREIRRRELESKKQALWADALADALEKYGCPDCDFALVIPRRKGSNAPLPESTQLVHALNCKSNEADHD